MAESMADESARAIQLANSLKIEDVPAKLRCGMCNKLAVDAVKLLCCSTSICEPCSHDIPETCAICTHSPTSPDDCTPDKKLRNTVRAFVKTEEKKRSRLVESTPAPPVQAPTPVPAPSETPVSADEAHKQDEAVEGSNMDVDAGGEHAEPADTTAGAAKDVQQEEQHHEMTPAAADGEQEQEEEEEDDDDGVVITTERPEPEAEQYADDQYQDQGYDEASYAQNYGDQGNGQHDNNNYGHDQQGYNNMNFNAMMGMPNGMGMGNFGMGMPNMMGMGGMAGMGGMNMDPSMMFSNGGFGGMGDMSAMMSMGMGGMNGMGGYGGMPGNMAMMGGGQGGFYGPGNSGGYNNHQQFGNQVNNNFTNQRGYYNRGRGGFGKPRGGFFPRGRGGYNSYSQYNGGNQNYANQQYNQGYQANNNFPQQTDDRRGSPTYEPMTARDGTSFGATDQERKGEGDDANHAATGTTNMAEEQLHADGEQEGVQTAEDAVVQVNNGVNGLDDSVMNDNAMQMDDSHSVPQHSFGYGPSRGGFGASGGAYGNVTTIGGESEQPIAPPMNAPKGPKAMRQGLPNSGRYSRPQQPSIPPPAAPKEHYGESEKPSRHGKSRSRSRSPSRRESRRDRERTPDEDRELDEMHEERKQHEKERRKRKDEKSRDKYEDKLDSDERSDKTKSRSDSVDDHERRKHRDRRDDRHSSRRDRSRERRKHRDRSRSPDSDRSSRKSKSDRTRGDDNDYERTKERHSSRKHSRRDDDYERDSKDRSRHSRHSRDDGKARDRDREREKRKATPEPVEDLGFSIKGAAQNKKTSLDRSMPPPASRSSRNDRRSSTQGDSTPTTPVEPAGDRYAADREKAIAKRMAKHNNSLSGKRKSRTEDEIPATYAGAEDHRAPRSKRQRQDTRRHSARFE